MHGDMGIDVWVYRGARALVILHERELRRFLGTWKVAKADNVSLEGTNWPSETTLDDILVHVLHWARDYLVWSCEKLRLPDPECAPVPEVGQAADRSEEYVAHLLSRWQGPLRSLPEEAFCEAEYRTRWGSHYPVEALLEHAIVHPMRHRLQLEELMGRGGGG